MNAVVFENVPVAELPEKWRAILTASGSATVTVTVTVRIEEATAGADEFAHDPLFGMWREREDMADVVGHLRKLRASRFSKEDVTGRD